MERAINKLPRLESARLPFFSFDECGYLLQYCSLFQWGEFVEEFLNLCRS
jgi:hypothetical protein